MTRQIAKESNFISRKMYKKALTLWILSLTFQQVLGGVHHNHNHKQSGERASDGAFSPRDHSHNADGNHDNAFDHEAILGMKTLKYEDFFQKIGQFFIKNDICL